MAQQLATSVENSFTKGLITEATGLNFPENAATDTDNCTYTLIGDVTRRLGIDREINFNNQIISNANVSVNSYKWNNAGGDGQSQIVVSQYGATLYFYLSSAATTSISNHFIGTVTLTPISGVTFDTSQECTFADGNGFLFIYHSSCDPSYVTFLPSTNALSIATIPLQIRDFVGAQESIPVNQRPLTLSTEHSYNIQNQGWTTANPWSGIDGTARGNPISLGSQTFHVGAGLTIPNGQNVSLTCVFVSGFGQATGVGNGVGSVTSYNSGTGTLILNVFSYHNTNPSFSSSTETFLTPISTGYVQTWLTAEGNYPSNADVWWYFKDNTDAFNPTTTAPNVDLATGQAPQGHYILPAFTLDRTLASGVAGITSVSTTKRPTNGCWFQGRVWYTGVSDNFPASGDVTAYAWTENIYFSQIVQTPSDFGSCYQTNDPTSQNLFDLLPTDGGVITIQGTGQIFKLFPVQNGMLVHAANGVWFITGSQGIGFTANDYTITKISSVPSISTSSFVDVLGLPYFWNEDGIYAVQPQQGGGLAVNPLTVGTIQTFYDNIPRSSKQYVHGAYHPIDYVIQWTYRSTAPTTVQQRYQCDQILNFNTFNKSFFPYSISNSPVSIGGIIYVSYPGSATAPPPEFKYLTLQSTNISFADEHDDSYTDWSSNSPVNYVSYFVTGFKLRGQGIKKWQPQYIQMYSRQNGAASAYKIQGIWDYANDPNSGRWSTVQVITNALTRFDTISRRHKIRGHGYTLQFRLFSVDGMPFDIQGWADVNTINQGT